MRPITGSNRRRAFTLIEAVIVLAVIGVVAAMVIPRYGRSLDRYRIDAAVDRITRDIELARRSADGRSEPCWIAFTDTALCYDVICGTSTSTTLSHVDLWREPYLVSVIKSNFAGGGEMDFNGFGVIAVGGTITLQSGATSVQVIVDASGTPTSGVRATVSVVNLTPQSIATGTSDMLGP